MRPLLKRVLQGTSLLMVVAGTVLAIGGLGAWSRGTAVAQMPCPPAPVASPSPTPSPPMPIGEICYPAG